MKTHVIANVDLDKLKISTESSVLDFGAGDGQFAVDFVKSGLSITTADVDINSLNKIISQIDPASGDRVRIKVLDPAEKSLPFADNEFSAIICREVLEHVEDPESTAREFSRISKKGARIMISVPAAFSEKVLSFIDKNWMKKSEHIRIFQTEDIIILFRKNGFVLESVGNKSFYWAFTWLILTLFNTDHKMGKIQNNLHIYKRIQKFWSILEKIGLRSFFELAGNIIFPKSYYFYFRNEKND